MLLLTEDLYISSLWCRPGQGHRLAAGGGGGATSLAWRHSHTGTGTGLVCWNHQLGSAAVWEERTQLGDNKEGRKGEL